MWEQMLVNLLRTAGQYEAVPLLVDALLAYQRQWGEIYTRYADVTQPPPAGLRFWQDRLTRLDQLLDEMRTTTLGD